MAEGTFMSARMRLTIVGVLSSMALLARPAVVEASVAITVPATVNLGSGPTGAGTRSAQLDTVQVTATGILNVLLPSFTATVSSTTFTTGAGTAAQTVPKASISYWSGPVTASTGSQTAVPGQLTSLLAQDLSVPRTAFASSGSVLTVTTITTSWKPTLVVAIPAAAVAGTYTATITHSVA